MLQKTAPPRDTHLRAPDLLGLVPAGLSGVFSKSSILRVLDRFAGMDGDRVTFTLRGQNFAVLKHPDDIGQVLSASTNDMVHSRFQKGGAGIRANEKVISNSDGERWKELRRNLAGFLGKNGLKSGFGDEAAETVRTYLDSWQGQGSIGVNQEATRLAIKYLFKAMFNEAATNATCDEMNVGAEALHAYMFLSTINMGLLSKATVKKLTGVTDHTQVADAVIADLVAGYAKAPAEVKEKHLFAKILPAEILDTIETVDQSQLRALVNEMLIAGQITNRSSFYWALHHLSRQPELQEQIAREARNGPLSFRPDADGNMPMAAKVTLETLRLHPPTFLFLKEAAKDFNGANGLSFSEGTTIVIPARLVHRDPRFYADPLNFAPDMHFAPQEMRNRSRFAYLPFGHGPHNCPGSGPSLHMITQTISEICTRYQLSPPADAQALPEERADFALHPENHSRLQLSPRGL